MVVISVYIYGVKIIKKFWWESGFLKGVPWNPPYALTEVWGTLCNKVLRYKAPEKFVSQTFVQKAKCYVFFFFFFFFI